jgi:hypothetical protein
MSNSSAIYPLEGGRFLFVPTTAMRRIHEASRPAAVGLRAELGRMTYRHWMRTLGPVHPWLADWLYTTRKLPPPEANGFKPTAAMEAFRKQSSYSSLISAVKKDYPKLKLSDSLIGHWRQLYKSHSWFDRWLLRGEEAPPEVTVVTVDQADRCERAWDFNEFCRRLECEADATYVQWMKRGLITSVGWLRWLFGWPEPTGSYVVTAGLQRLRSEMGREGITRAAGLHEHLFWHWARDERTRAMVPVIMEGGDPTRVPGWEELRGNTTPDVSKSGWESLAGNTKASMLKAARAARVDECCGKDRANVALSAYHEAVRKAAACGVGEHLREYLRCDGRYGPGRQRHGLVADNFFIPTSLMLAFREKAKQEGTKQRVTSLQDLPGIDTWFLDRATPKPMRGRRYTLSTGPAVPSGSRRGHKNGVVPSNPKVVTEKARVPSVAEKDILPPGSSSAWSRSAESSPDSAGRRFLSCGDCRSRSAWNIRSWTRFRLISQSRSRASSNVDRVGPLAEGGEDGGVGIPSFSPGMSDRSKAGDSSTLPCWASSVATRLRSAS